ncbi:hypothetical protein X737_36280 [Mesorhizobium sp. L48C026A00]|jgi:hypothetical protein|nr:hypothetical protein X737_36280 [Mesorhizobium sp. L48C026A00]
MTHIGEPVRLTPGADHLPDGGVEAVEGVDWPHCKPQQPVALSQ